MATSGNKSVKVTNYDTLKFSWSETSQSVANNTTTISWKMELIAGSSGRLDSSALKAWSVAVNGSKYSGNVSVGIANNATKTLASGSTTIKHNADGSKTFSYSFSQSFSGITFSGSSLGTVSGSGSGTLDTIPRQATITSAPNFNDEENPILKYSNPAGNAVTSLQACIGWTGNDDIAYRDISKTGTSYTFNLTTAERDKIRKACANANSMSLKFYIKTVIGGEIYYSRLAKTVTIVNANPTLNPVVKDTGANSIKLTGNGDNVVIKNYNAMDITFGSAALKGATIKSQKVVCGSFSRTTDGKLNYVDSNVFKFTVTDSRGNTTTKTITKTLVDYKKITCKLSNTKFTTDGVISFNITGNFWSGNFGAVNNSLDVKYKLYEKGSSGSWIATTPTINASNNTYSASVSVSGLDYQKKYEIVAYAADAAYIWANDDAVYTPFKTMSCIPVFDWGEDDFNFNVPVNMGENVIFDNGGTGIRGTTTTGIEVQAFAPCNTNNNCVIGYGGYSEEMGGTNLYGNEVRIYSKGSVTVNGMEIAENKVLWSGGYYMTDAHTINLSETVSNQANGIVLVFSRYNAGVVNESFSTHFIPKEVVSLHPGNGHNFNLCGMFANGMKYLYIHNDKIVGHANNSGERTVGGITYNNSYYVLRYVIGV